MALLEFNLLRYNRTDKSQEGSCAFNNLFELDELEEIFEKLRSRLSELEEARLIELAIRARHLEWCAFILRGMCASELRRRYTLRLSGGRGKRDQIGTGIQARMCRLAENLGISLTTLMTDARVSDIFFSNSDNTTLARETALPRDYYVIALSAPNPHEAIRVAIQRINNGGYDRDQFRAYVKRLKQNLQPQRQSKKTKIHSLIRLYVEDEVRTALEEIIQLTGRSEAEEVSAMILSRRKKLTRSDKGTRREVHSTKTVEAQNPSQMILIT